MVTSYGIIKIICADWGTNVFGRTIDVSELSYLLFAVTGRYISKTVFLETYVSACSTASLGRYQRRTGIILRL